MIRSLVAALAAVCALIMGSCTPNATAFAHPLYPGLTSKSAKSEARNPNLERRQWVSRDVKSGRNALSIARRYIGTNPTGWKRLWCAQFVNLVEKKAGRSGTGSASSLSFKSYGRKVASIRHVQPGDIVVLKRRGGGHVGYALGPAVNGKIKLRSGNTGGRRGNRIVADGYYPVSRVIAVRRVS